MNIIKRELRAGLKVFILWIAAVFVLIFPSVMKYEGFNAGGAEMIKLLDAMPRIVLAMLGMAGVDVNTLGGYSAVLFYFVLICAVIYAVYLGSYAVSREAADKTYEFIFTKPVSRGRVLAMKLLSGWLYLLFFCVLNAAISLAAVRTLKMAADVTMPVLLFSLSIFLTGSLFIALSAFLSAVTKRADKGSLWGNLAVLYAFILGVVYDMLENGGVLRLISPFKYFLPTDILAGRLDPAYTALTAALTAVLLLLAFAGFKKKDFT